MIGNVPLAGFLLACHYVSPVHSSSVTLVKHVWTLQTSSYKGVPPDSQELAKGENQSRFENQGGHKPRPPVLAGGLLFEPFPLIGRELGKTFERGKSSPSHPLRSVKGEALADEPHVVFT